MPRTRLTPAQRQKALRAMIADSAQRIAGALALRLDAPVPDHVHRHLRFLARTCTPTQLFALEAVAGWAQHKECEVPVAPAEPTVVAIGAGGES